MAIQENDDLVSVATFGSRPEAEVARGALSAANIESAMSADDAGGVQPALWVGEGIALLVRREDSERAIEILRNG